MLRPGSRLETLGEQCFAETGIREFLAPSSLREIRDGAFRDCSDLALVRLNEGLESLGTREAPAGKNKKKKAHTNGGAFQNSGIAEISLPGSLVEL